MYKKVLLLFALFYPGMQRASEGTWLEIKPSYFFFNASPMKHIYHHGGFEIQGSVSVPCWNCLDLYGSIGYRETRGRALNSCSTTKLTIIPVDIGLKPIFNLCEDFFYYFAIGPRYFHISQRNNSCYVDCNINGNGIGLFLNTGFNIVLRDCLLLGIFGEYSYEKKKICPCKPDVYSNGAIQIGGFAFGVSLGYAF